MRQFRLAIVLITMATACELDQQLESDLTSGLGGTPADWTCHELQTEYATRRAELVEAIANFESSYAALEASGRIGTARDANDAGNQSQGAVGQTQGDDIFGGETDPFAGSDSEPLDAGMLLTDDSPTSMLGVGADDIPELPASMATLRGVNGPYHDERVVAECDDVFGRFGQATDTQILEQCRLVVKLYNLLGRIKTEYNYGRDGQCRSGRAAIQTQQTSLRFPYCENQCRFGQTTCVQCTYETTLGSGNYICGEEYDARRAIETHCSENGLACTNIQCGAPQVFNDFAGGITGRRESDTKFSVKVTVSAKLEAEYSGGVTVKGHDETKIELKIIGHVIFKNGNGNPIANVHGGDTAAIYNCSVEVEQAIVRDMGLRVGAGFDVVIAKGSATAGLNTEFSAATLYKDISRDIPYSGTLAGVLTNCERYATTWATTELPHKFADNFLVRAVRSRFMGETKETMSRDVLRENIFCATDIPASLSSGNKVYRITTIRVALRDDAIEISSSYDGSINGFDRSTDTTLWKNDDSEQYASIRKKIFDRGPDALSNLDIRYMLERTWIEANSSRFTDCSRTGY